MKAAIITVDQIEAIEDALESSSPKYQRVNYYKLEQALALVKSLKIEEPIAWKKNIKTPEFTRNKNVAEELDFCISLYAKESE